MKKPLEIPRDEEREEIEMELSRILHLVLDGRAHRATILTELRKARRKAVAKANENESIYPQWVKGVVYFKYSQRPAQVAHHEYEEWNRPDDAYTGEQIKTLLERRFKIHLCLGLGDLLFYQRNPNLCSFDWVNKKIIGWKDAVVSEKTGTGEKVIYVPVLHVTKHKVWRSWEKICDVFSEKFITPLRKY